MYVNLRNCNFIYKFLIKVCKRVYYYNLLSLTNFGFQGTKKYNLQCSNCSVFIVQCY